MTTAYDTKFRSLSARLVDKFGVNVTLTRASETFSEITNKPTVGTPISYTIKVSPPVAAGYSEIDGARVLATDLFCTAAATNTGGSPVNGLPPNVDKDTLTYAGVVYKIVGCQPVYSGDLPAAYRLQLRC